MRKPDAWMYTARLAKEPYFERRLTFDPLERILEDTERIPLYLQDNEADLVMLVKRLARQHLARNEAASDLDVEAIGYLKRKGLIVSPSREAGGKD